MTDKEVGDLWRESEAYGVMVRDLFRGLIRKLVEERATGIWLCAKDRAATTYLDHVPAALRDFGIDPDRWEDER